MAFVRQFAVIALLVVAAGCATDRPLSVPADEMLLSEGDRDLTFRADRDGTVYVYNHNDDQILYSGKVERGQTISVDTERDRIELDGRPVMEKGIGGNDTRRVYFRPEATTERVIIEERRVTR